MSFLQDHINKLKANSFGKKSWVKRGDVEREKEEEVMKEIEEKDTKRKEKELQKLRELSFEKSMLSSMAAPNKPLAYIRAEEDKPEVVDGHISMVEKEAQEILEKERKVKENLEKPKRQKVEEEEKFEEEKAKEEEEEKKFNEEEMIRIRSELRKRRLPIKLFGESDIGAYKRLCKVEIESKEEIFTGQEKELIYKNVHTTLTDFQQNLKEKLKLKKPIDLEIGEDKGKYIELRKTKTTEFYDYKRFEKK
jgi:hypothetical protein